MTSAAVAMLTAGESLHGLLLNHQLDPIAPIIESLILVWIATEAEEWISRIQYLPL